MHLHPEWLWPTHWFDWAPLQKRLINQEKGNRICWCGRAARFKCVRLWPLQWGNRKRLQLPETRRCFVHAGKVKGIAKPGNCCSGLNAEQFCFSQEQGKVGGTGHSPMTAGCDCPRFSSSCLMQPSNAVSLCFGPQCVQNTAWSCAVKYHWGGFWYVQGTLDTLNWKNILKIMSHGPF